MVRLLSNIVFGVDMKYILAMFSLWISFWMRGWGKRLFSWELPLKAMKNCTERFFEWLLDASNVNPKPVSFLWTHA